MANRQFAGDRLAISIAREENRGARGRPGMAVFTRRRAGAEGENRVRGGGIVLGAAAESGVDSEIAGDGIGPGAPGSGGFDVGEGAKARFRLSAQKLGAIADLAKEPAGVALGEEAEFFGRHGRQPQSRGRRGVRRPGPEGGLGASRWPGGSPDESPPPGLSAKASATAESPRPPRARRPESPGDRAGRVPSGFRAEAPGPRRKYPAARGWPWPIRSHRIRPAPVRSRPPRRGR